MAVNISFDGFLCFGNVALPNCYYQAYFRQVNGQSSPSKWNAVRQADAQGYFSFNLGDGDFLGQDGNAAAGDMVIIAAWTGQSDRESLAFVPADRFGFIYLTLTTDPIYTRSFNVNVIPASQPYVDLPGLPTLVQRLTDFSFTNQVRTSMSTIDPGSGGFPGSVNSFQTPWYLDASQIILVFPCLQIQETVVDWYNDGITDVETFDRGVVGDTPYQITHQYADPPGTSVTIGVTATTIHGVTRSAAATFGIDIEARHPVPALNWDPGPPGHPLIQELVTFDHLGISDPDATISTIDYLVDGSFQYVDMGVLDTFQHVFTARGNRTARQTINWNDGFGPRTTVTNFTVIVVNEGPSALWGYDFFPSPSTTYTFFDTSTDREGAIANRAWLIEREDSPGVWSPIASGSGAGLTSFTYAFTVAGSYRTTLTVTDDQGAQDSYTQPYNVTIDTGGTPGGASRLRSGLHLQGNRRVRS